MAILEVKNVKLFYENAIAVNNVSLKVPEGQIVGVFGSNSAGKSSLMLCISGIIIDVKKKEDMKGGERIVVFGDVIFLGKNVINMKPSDRARLGLILCPERRRIFKESSTMENLKIGGYLANGHQAKETLEYVLTIFPQLKMLANREGGFLSGGEQQMLAIGRALMAQPKCLLMDEPLLGLAPAMEMRLASAIRQINQDKKLPIVLTEQYARPIMPIIDYGYVLENGSAVAEGTAAELMENPDVKDAYFGA